MCMKCAELFKTNVHILVDNVDKAGDKVYITSRLVERNLIRFLSALKFHPLFIKIF